MCKRQWWRIGRGCRSERGGNRLYASDARLTHRSPLRFLFTEPARHMPRPFCLVSCVLCLSVRARFHGPTPRRTAVFGTQPAAGQHQSRVFGGGRQALHAVERVRALACAVLTSQNVAAASARSGRSAPVTSCGPDTRPCRHSAPRMGFCGRRASIARLVRLSAGAARSWWSQKKTRVEDKSPGVTQRDAAFDACHRASPPARSGCARTSGASSVISRALLDVSVSRVSATTRRLGCT